MTTEPPLTPDVDLPGQQAEDADLDIVVQPEPEQDAEPDPAAAESNDPELGNTLIRPDNS